MYRVISNVSGSHGFFHPSFFPALINTCLSSSVWEQSGLPYILGLAGQFLPLIDDPALLEQLLVHLIIRFVHHTESEVSTPAVEAAALLLKSHPAMHVHREFADARLYERLEFLGGQANRDLTSAVVSLLLTTIALGDLTPPAWASIARLAATAVGSDGIRVEGLILLGSALAAPRGAAVFDGFGAVLATVINDFDGYSGEEKSEAAGVVANVFAYVGSDAVEAQLRDERFVDVAEACFAIDAEVDNLLNGLYAWLKRPGPAVDPAVLARLRTAVAGVLECESPRTCRVAEMVIECFQECAGMD
jgi:hypothetical protein